MRDNKANRNTPKNTSARAPALKQGATKPTSLAERREKAAIRLPEERRKGMKYQVIRGQYLKQSNKKENTDNAQAAAIKNAAAKQEEKQEKAKRQTAAATTVKNEKEKNKTSLSKNTSNSNVVSSASETSSAASEAKEEYAKSEKAAAYAERLQTNVELSQSVYIPPNVTWDNVLDHAVQKDSVYSQGGAAERAASYKEKADFYLKKMKKNTETGEKEINPNRDKDIGALYKKAYKLAHKEELLGKKDSTLFDKAQSVVQLKSEVDNALNKDSAGEAAAAAITIPFTHAATKAVRKLADKNKAVNAGKTGFELAAKVSAGITAADGVGEATANAVAAVPKYIVEKKVEKTVRQVMQNQHDRKIAAQKERLREKQEKVEKRAQQMKKENMQRNMKVDLYKSEHGIGGKGNVLQRMKSAIKNTIESMKRAITFIKSSGMMLMAAAGGALIPIVAIILILFIVVIFVCFPFFYKSKDGKSEKDIKDCEFVESISNYYLVMDKVVDDANEEIRIFVSSHRPKSSMHSYKIVWELPEIKKLPFVIPISPDKIPKDKIPKSIIYDEVLCTIAAYNQKLMIRPDTVSTGSGGSSVTTTTTGDEIEFEFSGVTSSAGSGDTTTDNGDIIFMNDENVALVYDGTESGVKFWRLTYKDVCLGFCGEGCPGHFETRYKLTFDFDIERLWKKFGFDDEDMKNYEEIKKDYDKEKAKAMDEYNELKRDNVEEDTKEN